MKPLGFDPEDHQPEQLHTIGILPARIGVGKVLPDIAVGNRPQQGIGQGMTEHIRIRMAVKPLRGRDVHATEHQPSAGCEAVNVIAYASAGHRVFRAQCSVFSVQCSEDQLSSEY